MAEQTELNGTFEFAVVAREETRYWSLPAALEGSRVAALYIVCVGEATHVCSLTPSSWAEFLENEFETSGVEDQDAATAELDKGDLSFENGGESGTYLEYYAPDSPRLHDRRTFTLDPSEFATENELRQAAWEEARDSYSSNSPAFEWPWEK